MKLIHRSGGEINLPSVIDGNSSSDILTAGSTFTGEWVDVSRHSSIVVSVKTDQNGTYAVEFSPDGVNTDSTLTRYYRTINIEQPHRFTVTRQYARVTFTNTSASDQTYFRLQTLKGNQCDLNTPLDSVMSQDYDSISVRPTKFEYESALGRRQGSTTWNKFGYNSDIDIGTEVLASWGGTYNPMTTARTLSIASLSANDVDGGTGCHGVVIYGVDENYNQQVVVKLLNGVTPVVTTELWLGVTRMAIFRAGSSHINEGVITATATIDSTIQAQIEIGEGTSQQCIYHVGQNSQGLIDFLLLGGEKLTGGVSPKLTFKGWVYSNVSNARYQVFRVILDTSVENHLPLIFSQPLIIGEKSTFWVEVTTDKDDSEADCRFSLIEFNNPSYDIV